MGPGTAATLPLHRMAKPVMARGSSWRMAAAVDCYMLPDGQFGCCLQAQPAAVLWAPRPSVPLFLTVTSDLKGSI